MRLRTPFLMLVFLPLAAPLQAGVVETLAGRLEGKVALDKDHLFVGDKKIAWADVLYVLADAAVKPGSRSQRVLLKNGESWPVEIVGLAADKLEVRSELFGTRKLDIGLVAGLVFQPRAADKERKLGTLYRVKGEPVKGKLLSITADKAIVDSAVGELDFPRETLVAYRFAEPGLALSKGLDEVSLTDSSVFFGKLLPRAANMKLEHSVLGSVELPVAAIRSIVRHPPGMLDLVELAPESVKTTPLLAPVKPAGIPALAGLRTIQARDGESAQFIKGLLCEPRTEVIWKLPKMDGKKGTLRVLLAPVPFAQADIRVTFQAGKKVLLQRDLPFSARPEALALDVAGGEVLEMLVDFGPRLRFPCGVILGDPHVLWE